MGKINLVIIVIELELKRERVVESTLDAGFANVVFKVLNIGAAPLPSLLDCVLRVFDRKH